MGNHLYQNNFDYTFLGEAGNPTSRLEGINKQFGTYLMVSEYTMAQLEDEFATRELSRIRVVGRAEPIRVYEPMFKDAYTAKEATFKTFNKGLQKFYCGEFQDALNLFETISERATICYRDDKRGSLLTETKRPGNGTKLERKVTMQPNIEEESGGAKGMLFIKCAGGSDARQGICTYSFNLDATLGYVQQIDERTEIYNVCQSEEQPKPFNMSMPMFFQATIAVRDKPLADTWSISGSISRDLAEEDKRGNPCSKKGRQKGTCEYVHLYEAQWNLVRIDGCENRATRVSGDVEINGKPVAKGDILKLAKGDVIRTGPNARFEMNFGNEVIRLDGDTEFNMYDPCNKDPERKNTAVLIGGKVQMVVNKLVGPPIEIRWMIGTAGGVRGDASPARKTFWARMGLPGEAYAGEPPPGTEMEQTLGMQVAQVAFDMENIPGGKLEVRVIKGAILVMDAQRIRTMLITQGQRRSNWDNGQDFTDIYVIVSADALK